MAGILTQAGVVAGHAWLLLASPPFLRAYAVSIVVFAYVGAAIYVLLQVRFVANLRRRIDEHGNAQALIGDATVRGAVPTRDGSRDKQRSDLKRRPMDRVRRIVLRSVGIAAIGIALPLLVLSVTGRYYDFMFPGSEPLTDAQAGHRVAHPGVRTVAEFAFDQLYLASPGDTFEIAFERKPSVSFDRSDKFFLAAVWANRILCESSIAALIFLLTQGAYYAARPSRAEAKRLDALGDGRENPA